jgi:xanthine dehydrogenase YagR molybdenum-binding subunit
MLMPSSSATSPTTSGPGAERIVGQPIDRVDGRLKVTGAAAYADEVTESSWGAAPAHGFILTAAIAKGRMTEISTVAAEAAPGVLFVMTHRNAPRQGHYQPEGTPHPAQRFSRPRPVLVDDRVRRYGEPVALVVAETYEAARGAAALLDIRYERAAGIFDLAASLDRAYKPELLNAGFAPDSAQGDVDSAFATAPIRIDAAYETAYQHHNPMEPHASTAVWSGEELTLYTSTQNVANLQTAIAATLTIDPARVRVLSPFTGGGFGCKLLAHADAVLAALAARALGRPVRVAFTRQQMFANAGHRPMMLQKVRLGSDAGGRLRAIAHEVWSQTAPDEEFAEQTAVCTRSLYAAPHRATRHRLVRLDLACGEWMRAPGEAPGLLALESAMDELAHELGLDPIELRISNEPALDPERQVPFSSRNLVACLREGAHRFGWQKRASKPASVREGRLLIGYGVASAIRPNYLRESKANVRIDAGGRVTARLDMTDIGTGSYTVLSQIVADTLGVPLASVTVELGDSRFPKTAGSGGSLGAASSGSALFEACRELREKLTRSARAAGAPLSDASPTTFARHPPLLGQSADELSSLMRRIAPAGLEADGTITPGDSYKTHSQHAFGAHFVEVSVDVDTAEVRLRRMLGVFAAGNRLNEKTARSQVVGGMIWGVGSALMEESVVDTRYGAFINHDLALYHVPVNADIGEIDAVFLDEQDDQGNPLGIKGIGELGICGAGAAVGNAIFNATGVRVRTFPITIDRLLPGLASLA